MDIGAYIAASGAITNERTLEYITHNLANASTAGFKESTAHMEAVPFSLPRTDPAGSESLAFVQMKPPVIDKEQGMVKETGRALDLAIEGEGNFQVQTPGGVRSVRDGRCRLTPTGTLVSTNGYPLLDDKGKEIVVDRRKRTDISENGEIRSGERRLGRLMIVDEQGKPVKPEAYRVSQGYLEKSNVDPMQEMVGMLEQLRNHQSYLKLIKGFDELEGKTIQEMGKV